MKGRASQSWMWPVVGAISVVDAVLLFTNLHSIKGTETSTSTSAMSVSTPQRIFAPTIENKTPRSAKAPQGMEWIPGGGFSMGAQDALDMNKVAMQATHDSRPIHRVYVDAFWMDKTDVTNGEFARFVRATGYITVAERKPRAEDFPGAPPENLLPGAVVFRPPNQPVPLNDHYRWWSYVPGANWKHPEGHQRNLKGRESYPVVDIAYEGAVAYASWAGKRLPTEAEWEFAARGGLSGKPFAWGDEFRPQGQWMANTFQGHFPDHDTGEDGHVGITAAAQYPPNRYDLYDMAGNDWQWTSDWYRPDYYQELARPAKSRTIRKVQARHLIRLNQARPNESCGAVRFSAPISTVRAIWLGPEERARSARALIILVSAA